MSRNIVISLVFIVALTFMISCSSGDGNIVTPEPVDRDDVAAESTGGTICMGLWQVVIDTKTGTGDIVRLRSADKIINVLGFMEPPALNMMDLDWPNLVIADPVIEVGVILTHPILGAPEFRGFDVRGVCFGPEVTNADGLTILTSPQYFKGVPFGYQDGLLGVPDSSAHYKGLAGYKYFCDGLNATENLADFFTDTGNVADRGSFKSGQTNQRDYILDWTNSTHAFFVFNYAIYANYDWPVGGETLDDFDIETANSAEAFACKVTELANSLYYADGFGGGGDISLQVEAWDWQGDISKVTIESLESGIIAQADYDVALGVFPSGASYGYEFYAVPGTPTEVGDLDILITVTDTKTFGECWFMDLLPTSNSRYNLKLYNCFIYTTTVMDCPPAVVTEISPDSAFAGDALDDAEITGTFLDGPQLAVKLTKTGETDIDASDVTFIDISNITCDIDTAGAAIGDWNVEVTNGCGTSGSLPDGFEIIAAKNLELRSGVTALDLAMVKNTGELYILYSDGQVWEYTEANSYQSGSRLYTTSTRACFMDASANGDSIVEGTPSAYAYSRSYYANGNAASLHTAYNSYQWATDPWCPTGGTNNNKHCTWYSDSYPYYPAIYWGWQPPSYGGAGGNHCNEGFGIYNVHHTTVVGVEADTNSYVYALEKGPEYRVERRTTSFTSLASYYWGGSQNDTSPNFWNPKDITRDTGNTIYVLDELSTNEPAIKKFSYSGTVQGTFGDSTTISSTPLRIEGTERLFGGSGTNLMFVLHGNSTDGYFLSIFLPAELTT